MLRALKAVSNCASFTPVKGDDESIHTKPADRPVFEDPTAHVPAHVLGLETYQVGKSAAELSREIGIPESRILKLASNENPHGMSPHAQMAIQAAVSAVPRYPDEYELRCDLARMHALAPENVILCNGSDELINTVARTFLGPGKSAVMSQYAYLSYRNATETVGATVVEVKAKDFGHDLDAMREAIDRDTRVVWIANPNNPTGSLLPAKALEGFLRAVPRDVVVVLDEAYVDYLPHEHRPPVTDWLAYHPNLVVARTFSKIHGLAGLRMGYGLASARMSQVIGSVRQTYSCNSLGLAAARASLRDPAFTTFCREDNQRGLKYLSDELARLGIETLPAHGNFIAFRIDDAAGVHRRMLEKGVILRPLTQYKMPDFLRVSVGAREHNQRFIAALEEVLVTNFRAAHHHPA